MRVVINIVEENLINWINLIYIFFFELKMEIVNQINLDLGLDPVFRIRVKIRVKIYSFIFLLINFLDEFVISPRYQKKYTREEVYRCNK